MLLALNAKNAKTPFEWFDLFFLNEMIEKIAEYTNGSIQIVLDEFADTTDSTIEIHTSVWSTKLISNHFWEFFIFVQHLV